jgi:hypothetical protein
LLLSPLPLFVLIPFDSGDVGVKAFVSRVDQLSLGPFLADAGLVAGYQENGLALRVESKCNPPNTVSCVKSQFLHIRVTRTVERIGPRPPQLRTELFQQCDVGKQLVLHVHVERAVLRNPIVMQINLPPHLIHYALK